MCSKRVQSWLIGLALFGLAGAACTGPFAPGQSAGGAPDKLTMRLGFSLAGNRLHYIAALQKGFYKAENLDVDIREGEGGPATAQLVANGNVMIGDFGAGTLLPLRDKGITNLKMIAVYTQRSTYAILAWKDKGINSPKDLAGKTLGVSPGEAPLLFLPTYLGAVGVDGASVRQVPLEPSLKFTAFQNRQVDAITTLATSLPPPYFAQKDQFSLFYYADAGLTLLSDGVIVTDETLRDKRDPLKRFLKANERAFQACQADAMDCANQAKQWKETVNVDLLVNQWRIFEQLTSSERSKGKPFGWAAEQDWVDTIQNLREFGLLKTPTVPADVYTSELLPAS